MRDDKGIQIELKYISFIEQFMTLSLSANTLYKEIFRKKRHISKIPIMKIINFNISKSIKFLKQVQLF